MEDAPIENRAITNQGIDGPLVDPAQGPSTHHAPSARSMAPVFVLGCNRSGTKFLYYTLLSAGGFAVYHEESNAFTLLGLHFGNLANRHNRRRLLDAYFGSKFFQRTGLEPADIEGRVMADCHNAGDFLCIVMEAVARKQGVARWAESTPRHLLYLPLIKKLIPNALVVHIIRDGRDVTASMQRYGRIRPLPWDRGRDFIARAIFWQWIVSKGRRHGRSLGEDYLEIHYEDLVRNPRETVERVGKFIEHDLDYDRIQKVGLGAVRNPNSSFRGDSNETSSNSIGRWKRMFTQAQVRDIEWSARKLLTETGYALETPRAELRPSLYVRFMNLLYPLYFDSRLWLKANTPLARLADRRNKTLANYVANDNSMSLAKDRD
jgi:Sulfotransferase family